MDSDFLDLLLACAIQDTSFLRRWGHLYAIEDFVIRDVPGYENREKVAAVVIDHWKRYGEAVGEQLRGKLLQACKGRRMNPLKMQEVMGYGKRLKETPVAITDSIGERFVELKRAALLHRTLDSLLEKHGVGELNPNSFAQSIGEFQKLEARLRPSPLTLDNAQDLQQRLHRRSIQSRQRGYWTGIDGVDAIMGTPAVKGYFCVVLGLAKFGKSTCLTYLALSAAMQGARVLYLTLEDAKDLQEQRHDAVISGVPYRELAARRDDVYRANRRFWSMVMGRVKIVDGTESVWRVSDIDALITREKDAGFVPDVVVIDYYMEIEADGHHKEYRWKSDEISRALRRMATHQDVLLWTAQQAAINADTMGAREVTMAHLAEDRGLARKVHLLIGMGNGDWNSEDLPKGIRSVYFHVAASKFCPMGSGVNVMADYNRALIYDADATNQRVKQAEYERLQEVRAQA